MLLIVVGIAVRTGSGLSLMLVAVTIGFFHAEVAYEERLLTERFPDYRAYAAVTPLVPRRCYVSQAGWMRSGRPSATCLPQD